MVETPDTNYLVVEHCRLEDPNCSYCDVWLGEAWERMTDGGMRIQILPTRVSDNPWGMGRFRELLPLNLVSYEDRSNGKWY